jgi:nucleoside phosphorylase/tetratricopeptide (TPR) repeat protein
MPPTDPRRALVLTALPVEYAAVRAHLENHEEAEHPLGDVYERGQFQTGAQAWEVGIVEMGAGNPNAATKTERAIDFFKPEVVLFVGVAGGLKDVVVGDVVVATKVYGYHAGKAEAEFKTRPEVRLPHHRILERARAEARKTDWHQRLQSPNPAPTVYLGAIAAGEQVVVSAASNSYQLIRHSYGDALAVEMESYGFFTAVQAHAGLEALAVRGISDLLENKAEADAGGSQPRASRHAAAFAFEVLAKLKLPPKNGGEKIREVIVEVPVRPAETIRSTLPHQPYFFGRKKELDIIAEAIAPEARTWGALIDGPGGIGKTALAVRAGHLASVKQFPLKLFLSAKVRELTPAGEQPLTDSMLPSFQELLKELARELGEEGIERVKPDERAKIIRSALAGRRALLVIDNVETLPEPERVRLYQFLCLLPVCCKAIVTSRRRSDIDARAIRLDRLSLDEAQQLLAELALVNRHLQKADEAERRQLYEHTNGNPLLIRWLVGQLGRSGSHCRSITEACIFLDKAPNGNDPLEYVFGDLLDTFTDNESAVLAALTHFDGPAKLQWLAELTGLAYPVALTALEDLADRALLVSDAESQTFFLSRYMGTYLRRKRQEAVAQTGERLAERAYALVIENGYQNYTRFELLETEWQSVAPALSLLAMQVVNERLQEACHALFHFLNFFGHWDEALRLNCVAEAIALTVDDFHNAGWRTYHAGFFHFQLGEASKLSAATERCESYWSRSQLGFGLEEKQAWVRRLRGRGFMLNQDYQAAMEAFAESVNLRRGLDPVSRELGFALMFLAHAEQMRGELVAAESHLCEALQIAMENNDSEAIAANTGELAELAIAKKNWLKAGNLAKEGLERSETLGRMDYTGFNCRRLAQALTHQNRHEEALPLAQRAVNIFTRLRMPDELEQARAVLQACGGEPNQAAFRQNETPL